MCTTRLMDQVRSTLRVHHYSLRTEESYLHWIKRFILFHGKRCTYKRGSSGSSFKRLPFFYIVFTGR